MYATKADIGILSNGEDSLVLEKRDPGDGKDHWDPTLTGHIAVTHVPTTEHGLFHILLAISLQTCSTRPACVALSTLDE